MAVPNSRTQLREHCLRRLGKPVIEINVDPDQVEDCIDDAIQLFQEFHSDATKRIYLKHQVTTDDVTNQWIPVSDQVQYVSSLLPFDQSNLGVGSGMFSIKYQIHLGDLMNGSNFMGELSYYSQIGQYLETLDMVLTGVPLVTFQRHENRLYIFGEWWDQEIKAGDWLVMEAYQYVDPTGASSIYNNIFMKNYTTALIKQRWGQNMSKFDGIQLPGGVTISGKDMFTEASAEIEKLEEKMRLEYEVPPDFMIG